MGTDLVRRVVCKKGLTERLADHAGTRCGGVGAFCDSYERYSGEYWRLRVV